MLQLSPERRSGRVVVVVDHALDVLHEVLLIADVGGRACVIGVALIIMEVSATTQTLLLVT